jgi:hypothetical protein
MVMSLYLLTYQIEYVEQAILCFVSRTSNDKQIGKEATSKILWLIHSEGLPDDFFVSIYGLEDLDYNSIFFL